MEAWVQAFPFKSESRKARVASSAKDNGDLCEEAVLEVAAEILGRNCQDLESQVLPLAEQLLRVPKGTLRRPEKSHRSLEEHVTQVLLGCAVECRERDTYIAGILKLPGDAQQTLKGEIEDLFDHIRIQIEDSKEEATAEPDSTEAATAASVVNKEGVDDGEVAMESSFNDEAAKNDASSAPAGQAAAEDNDRFTIHSVMADASVDSSGGLLDELEGWKTRVHELTQEKMVLEQSIIEKDGVHEDLRIRLSVAEARATELAEEKEKFESERRMYLSTSNPSLASPTSRADSRVIEDGMNACSLSPGHTSADLLAKTKAQNELANQKIAELETTLERLQDQSQTFKNLESSRERAKTTIQELKTRLSTSEKQAAAARELSDRLKRSEQAVERLVNEVQAYRKNLKELTDEKNSLQHQIEDLTEQNSKQSDASHDTPSGSPWSANSKMKQRGSPATPTQASKIEALQALNARLDRQVRTLDAENRETAAKLRSLREEYDRNRQESEAEIKEWSEYAQSLEGDREKKEILMMRLRDTTVTLDALHKAHVKLQTESKREIDFWSQKVMDLHHEFVPVQEERDTLQQQLRSALETQRMQNEDFEAFLQQRDSSQTMKRRLVREFNSKLNNLMKKLARLEDEVEIEREARQLACSKYEQLVQDVPRQVAAQVQEHVTALQDAEEPALRNLLQAFSAGDSPSIRRQSYVRDNLDAMVQQLITTPHGKSSADGSAEGAQITPMRGRRSDERALTHLRDVNGRLERENAWLREQFEGRGAPPSPKIDFDSAQTGPSDSLVLATGGSSATRHLRAALVELQRENAALRDANVAEIEERAKMENELHALRRKVDILQLKSTHASTKMIRQKRVPAEAVSSWFQTQLQRVSKDVQLTASETEVLEGLGNAPRLPIPAHEVGDDRVGLVNGSKVLTQDQEDDDMAPLEGVVKAKTVHKAPDQASAPQEKENLPKEANSYTETADAADDLCKTFVSASDLEESGVGAASGSRKHVESNLPFQTPRQSLGPQLAGKRGAKDRAGAGKSKAPPVPVPANKHHGLPTSPASSVASWSSAELAAHARRKRQNANHSFESGDSETFFRALQSERSAALGVQPLQGAGPMTRAGDAGQARPKFGASRRIFNESMESAK